MKQQKNNAKTFSFSYICLLALISLLFLFIYGKSKHVNQEHISLYPHPFLHVVH